MKQLGLPLILNEKMLLHHFVGSKNQQILSFVNQLLTHKNASVVYVYGEHSYGKTHLLQGITFTALAQNLEAFYIDIKQELPNGVMDNLDIFDWVCIDNIDYLDRQQQQTLFDLYNTVQQTNTKLILSGRCSPNELKVLEDLKTRLSLAFVWALESLSDAEKIGIIKQKVQDKNLKIDDKIYPHLFKYYSRDLQQVLCAIDKLDKASLQQQKKISVALVKETLI